MFTTEQPEVVKTINMPPGFKSEKEKAMEEQGKAQATPTGEKDLGGPLTGGEVK